MNVVEIFSNQNVSLHAEYLPCEMVRPLTTVGRLLICDLTCSIMLQFEIEAVAKDSKKAAITEPWLKPVIAT